MLIHDICQALARFEVPYALVGGHAVALHGAVRGTVDIDFVIEWQRADLEKAVQALQSIGLRSALPLGVDEVWTNRDRYITERNLIAWNFVDFADPLRQVDLLINYDLTGHTVDTKPTPSGTIQVLNKQDLIEMKRQSGRRQDLEDIRSLEAL